ncbi:TVP38/TMEM64 family protein [Paenibacillus sp. NPDC058071]|uniref:TVP38/TMEM64 family protein n=1 Tax=Paenibacillus sp. NPDC058071 TaxID=3346326 RepID=UPI0036D975D3
MKYSKLYVFVIYILLVVMVYVNQDSMMNWLQTDGSNQLPIIFLGTVLLAIVPLVPFGIVGAVIGAKYGFLVGGLLNIAASSIAALITYSLFYFLFRQQGMAYLAKSNRLQTIEESIRKNAFWSVLIGRLIPIMPAFIINCYAGTFRLAVKPFLLATVLGKIPAMLVFAYVGDNAFSGAMQWVVVLLIYCLFLLTIYLIVKLAKYKKQI